MWVLTFISLCALVIVGAFANAISMTTFSAILIKEIERRTLMAFLSFETVQTYFYTVIIGVIILLVGFGIGILAKKIILRLLREMELNRIMSKVGITNNVERAVSSIISYVIYLITIVVFLRRLGIDSIVLYLILGGVLTLIILAFLVGLKDIIPNLIGWIYLQRHEKIKEGRFVEIREIAGTVEKIGYLETEIQTERGDILYVPNCLFLKNRHRWK